MRFRTVHTAGLAHGPGRHRPRPAVGGHGESRAYADDGHVFESIWVYDHFHTVPVVSDEATHEAWTLMSALAMWRPPASGWARCAPV